jgi:small conductance mechanosensitive channel
MAADPEVEVRKRVETLTDVVNRTTATLIAIVALVTILPEFGLNAGPLIAGLGIVGIAVGFGCQNVIKDVINGLEVLTENQYARGDFVSIRSATGGSVSGVVEDINLRRTVLRDFEGNVHFVSHGQIDFASNHTKGYSRVVLSLSIANSADLDRVHRIVGQVGTEMMKDPTLRTMLREQPHVSGIERLGDSAFDIRVEATTEPGEQWKLAPELRRRLKLALDTEAIKSKDKD